MSVRHRRLQPEDPARVIVLGATGFVGADLVHGLRAAGVRVLGLGSRDLDLVAPDAAVRLQDVLRPDDAVVFGSALTPDRGDDTRVFMQNLAMAEHVSAAVAKTPCAHLLYVSSDAVYRDSEEVVDEATCASPSTLYGTMHVAREQIVRHALAGPDVPLLVLRPSLLYGPGDTHTAYGPNRFVRSAERDGQITLFGQGEESRDHVWVRDVSRLMCLALRQRSEGVLNVVTGRSLSFREVADAVTGAVGRPVQLEERVRVRPITHRRYDNSATASAFPQFRYTGFTEGFYAAWRERSSRGW